MANEVNPLFERKAYQGLLSWKEHRRGSTALLVEGARRVGKTTLVEAFGSRAYKTVLKIDFSRYDPTFRQRFLDLSVDLNQLFDFFEHFFAVKLHERESLIIFDEVQEFPPARALIKHLVADGRFDYIETGSLVSIKKNVQHILLPSEEHRFPLGPMDFEEYLWARGQRMLADYIRQCFEQRRPLENELHRRASRFWDEYLVIGGMPQVVASFIRENDLSEVRSLQDDILALYRGDIDRHGGTSAKAIKRLFGSIPAQLSGTARRIVYAKIDGDSKDRFHRYLNAFGWLEDSSTVNFCTAVRDPSLALKLTEDESRVKAYLVDTGLLLAMATEGDDESAASIYRQLLLGQSGVNRGMLTENVVAQQLVASRRPLHYYERYSRDKAERMEIDFLVTAPHPNSPTKTLLSPIEVKSGSRSTTVSLDRFKAKFKERVGQEYVLHPRQLKVDGKRLFAPLYMSFCI